MNSFSEENYLKAIFQFQHQHQGIAGTTDLAALLNVKASSVTAMLIRLKEKGLITYQKYQGVMLTDDGRLLALNLIRKHRLWETFLAEKLGFEWDKVHELAEQLEHIQSDELTQRLDAFLGNPAFDPHGEVIPGKNGEMQEVQTLPLADVPANETVRIVSFSDHSSTFKTYLDSIGLKLNATVAIVGKNSYDGSITLSLNGHLHLVSEKAAKNLLCHV